MAVVIGLALVTITLAVVHDGADAASIWRHAYHVPVVAAAVHFGGAGVVAVRT